MHKERRYNGMFSFTALGAGGIEERSWTEPRPPSMLCLHGKAYIESLIFYRKDTITSPLPIARFYIFYNSEFRDQASSLKLNLRIANTLRTHVHNNNISWARYYKSAVDNVLNAQQTTVSDNSESSFIEFAERGEQNK